MTPPDVWTSEAVPETGRWYVGHKTYTDDRPDMTVRIEWLIAGTPMPLINGKAHQYRSLYPIPSAERLAAMERAVEALQAIPWHNAMTYEGNLEAHVYLSVDALEAVRAALAAVEAAQ